jgi:hypothetical protein
MSAIKLHGLSMNHRPVDVLKQAKKIISDPAHWTQRSFARNKDGKVAVVASSDAISFCALGAMRRASYELGYPLPAGHFLYEAPMTAIKLLEQAALNLYRTPISNVNDNFGYKEVMKCFDRAIENS